MSKLRPLWLLSACCLLLLIPGLADGKTPVDDFSMSQIFPIDRGHSYVGFSVKYMGFAKVKGRFADFSGTFRFDPNDITRTSATLIIEIPSIDTDHDFRDRDLKSDNWFDAEKYPTMTFQTKKVIEAEEGTQVIGDLTLRGVTKEVAFKMEYCSGLQKDVRGDAQVIFTGTATIDRTEFGVAGERWSRVKEGMTAVASQVDIELSILGKQINEPNFKNWVRNVERPPGKIYQIVAERGVEAGVSAFNELRSTDGDAVGMGVLNTVGYMLLKEGRTEDAIAVFKRNVEIYPDNSNVHDSLAEAYATKGDHENARAHYEMALEKNPMNANAIEILRHLTSNH